MAEERSGKFFCQKCKRTMVDSKFYTYRDGTKCELCKSCLTMHINNYEPDSYLWLMEKFDVPYIEEEWINTREKEFEKNYDKVLNSGASKEEAREAAYKMTKGSGVVFGKYLAKMKLTQWRQYRWADTERLKVEAEEKAKLYGAESEEIKKQAEEMKEAFARGEISEAQYMTYNLYEAKDIPQSLEQQFLDAGGPSSSSKYPVNEHPFEEVELVDVGVDLTQEDKVYLAMKWGRLYKPDEWVYLEKLYDDFSKSFEVKDPARIDTLKMICKTSLKMNQAIDCGDVDSYQKLSRVYDAMMKAGKFTEAQKKDNNAAEFDSIGAIFRFCEKEGGFIPEYEIVADKDIIDTIIRDNHEYLETLIHNDTNLSQQIEQFLKKQEIMWQQKKDKREARERGSEITVSDEDFRQFYETIDEDRKEDNNLIKEEDE